MADFKVITVTELPALLGTNNIQLVDVRTDAEIARGRIKGAISLPLQSLPARLKELDTQKTTVFYCQVGARSAQASLLAVSAGFADVSNLQGGITAWAHAGGEVAV